MADYQLTTQSLLDPNAQDLQTLNRQQQFAQGLMNQGLQGQPQGQMVSGFYVKPSITQALNPLAQALTGAYLGNKAEAKGKELATALRGKQQEAVQNYIQALQSTPAQEGGIQGPNGQMTTQTTPDMYNADMSLNPAYKQVAPVAAKSPDYNAAFQAATSPYAPAPLQAAGYEMLKPQKLGEGETLQRFNFNNGQFTPLASGGEKLPTEYKEYQKAAEGGFKGTFFDYQQALKRAGASNVSVRTGNSLAEQIGPMMKESAAQTVGAMKTADAADQILGALKTGNIIAGPGANVRLPLAQVANMVGAGGKDEAEKLANTRVMVQNLAKLTLAGRQQMHGEGAISNSESGIAERAMSGNIDLTAGEIAQLANAAKRSAAYQVQSHNQRLKVMESNPETRGLAPYYQVNGMTPIAPTGGNNVVDYNSLK